MIIGEVGIVIEAEMIIVVVAEVRTWIVVLVFVSLTRAFWVL